MEKKETVDYLQAAKAFSKAKGQTPEDFDFPLDGSKELSDGVDYLKVSQEYMKYLVDDQSEVIHNEK